MKSGAVWLQQLKEILIENDAVTADWPVVTENHAATDMRSTEDIKAKYEQQAVTCTLQQNFTTKWSPC